MLHVSMPRSWTRGDVPIIKGVAKLGFSWEALDVKFWEGRGTGLGSKHVETTSWKEDVEAFCCQTFFLG